MLFPLVFERIQNLIFICAITLSLVLNSCNTENDEITKKDPVITWNNPTDIEYGTLLSETQLNATADVNGTFVYTPTIGTKLEVGDNQELKVDFTPTDLTSYNTVNKTVKINVVVPAKPTDGDGNIYGTVTIGTQTWFAENLKTTKYNDGTTIATDREITPSYAWYNNDISNKDVYGALYNWYAVDATSNGNKNICPTGWHVPTDAEWTTLTTELGGESDAGGAMKETGTTHWESPNTGATNESGFTALPSGYRDDGSSYLLGGYGYYWSSTEGEDTYAWSRYIVYVDAECYRLHDSKELGFAVRCIKD